jgi:hypothetical protein
MSDEPMVRSYVEGERIMAAHKWAKEMVLYAQDATETDKPYDRWESKHTRDYGPSEWTTCRRDINWDIEDVIYRRKPKPKTSEERFEEWWEFTNRNHFYSRDDYFFAKMGWEAAENQKDKR